MNASTYRRAEHVLWREGIDRVLVRTTLDETARALDLGGPEALVWMALEEPCDAKRVAERLAEFASYDEVDAALRNLHAEGLLKR